MSGERPNDVPAWERFWPWEAFRRACDPVDFRRWKRDSQRELWERFGARDPLVLDATLGLGDHSINLFELGFRVESCDDSPVALALARESLDREGARVHTFRARWEELAERTPGRYDLVFHDALHWVYEREELLRAARGLRGCLAPGGALCFFFADAREPEEGAGRRWLAWDWEHLAPVERAWEHSRGGRSARCTRYYSRGEDYIDERNVYEERVGEGWAPAGECTLRRVYRWDWHALTGVLREAGFGRLESHPCQNVKGYDYALNLAW